MSPDQWVALWFPEADESRLAQFATRRCVSCPVRIRCIEESIRHPDQPGIWAGIGTDQRRALAQQYRPGHQWDAACKCSWCELVTRILDGKLVNVNGPGAQCGRIATYARSCRCRPCRFAMNLRNYLGTPTVKPPGDTMPEPTRPTTTCRHSGRGRCRSCQYHDELLALT